MHTIPNDYSKYMYIAHISNLQITIALKYCINMRCKLIVQVQSIYIQNNIIMLRKTSQWGKRPQNGPWHHHSAAEGLAVKEETRKCFMVSPSCCGRPHGDIKDHKMAHGVTFILRRPRGDRKDQKLVHGVIIMLWKASRWQKKTEIDPWCHHHSVEDLTVTKNTKNVTLWHYRSAVGLAVTEMTRKWSMVSPSCCRRPHGGK